MTKITPYVNIHTHHAREDETTITTVGVHPYLAESDQHLSITEIDAKVEAIGEIGLDYSREIDRVLQEELFVEQLHLAEQLSLPVVLHSVRAFEPTIKILENFALRAVIFHGFIGSVQQAQEAIRRGYYLSFGLRCFSSPKTIKALESAPLDSIFLETDDDEISIEEIYHKTTTFRPESIDELKNRIYNNYIRVFQK